MLLFIPNEQLYGFIQEHDGAVLDQALERKIVMCSPLTLFAVLAVVRQAVDSFRLERTTSEILEVLGTFSKQWDGFVAQMDTLGKRLESTASAYDQLVGARRRQLERQLDRIEDLRTDQALALTGGAGSRGCCARRRRGSRSVPSWDGLGASTPSVFRLVLSQALRLVAIGVVTGLIAAGAFTRVLETRCTRSSRSIRGRSASPRSCCCSSRPSPRTSPHAAARASLRLTRCARNRDPPRGPSCSSWIFVLQPEMCHQLAGERGADALFFVLEVHVDVACSVPCSFRDHRRPGGDVRCAGSLRRAGGSSRSRR